MDHPAMTTTQPAGHPAGIHATEPHHADLHLNAPLRRNRTITRRSDHEQADDKAKTCNAIQ